MKIKGMNLRYVFTDWRPAGILFRGRIYLSSRLMPEKLADFGKLWAMGYINQGGMQIKACCPEKAKSMDRFKKVQADNIRKRES